MLSAAGREWPARGVCLHSHMKQSIAALAAILMVGSAPAAAYAQSTGSLGSTSGDPSPAIPALPAEHEPNPLELETFEVLNEVLDEGLDLWDVDITVTLERDANLSRLAQLGAELSLPKFVDHMQTVDDDQISAFRPEVLVYQAPYVETYVCGPAPLALDTIRTAYRQSFFRDDQPGDDIAYENFGFPTYEKPVAGIGFAEGQGYACSYMLQQSANHPFR